MERRREREERRWEGRRDRRGEEEGEERRGEVESSDFSREVLIFDDFTYDFSWEVLKFTISTSHFMVCFEHLTKKVSIL